MNVKASASKYEVRIWWSAEDGVYVAEVPELPGCMAHGRTREAALTNVNDAIKLWLKTARELGREIPEPRGHLEPA